MALKEHLQPELHPTRVTSQPNMLPPKAVPDNRSSHESSWESHTAGSDLGTDGVSREDTPALLSSLVPLVGVQMNGIDRSEGDMTLTEEGALVELGEGRSPVEEAGHEEEEADDEGLCCTVEEGEEAALALDAPPSEPDLSWLSLRHSSGNYCGVPPLNCTFQDPESNQEHEAYVENSEPQTESQAPHESNTAHWDMQTCHSADLA